MHGFDFDASDRSASTLDLLGTAHAAVEVAQVQAEVGLCVVVGGVVQAEVGFCSVPETAVGLGVHTA